MAWDVEYLPDTDSLELRHTGSLTSQDTREQAHIVLCLMHETLTARFLLDYSEAVAEVPDAEVRALPDLCIQLGAPLHIRVALVVPRSLFRIATFDLFAQAAREKGFSVELFRTREQALQWLACVGEAPDPAEVQGLAAGNLSLQLN